MRALGPEFKPRMVVPFVTEVLGRGNGQIPGVSTLTRPAQWQTPSRLSSCLYMYAYAHVHPHPYVWGYTYTQTHMYTHTHGKNTFQVIKFINVKNEWLLDKHGLCVYVVMHKYMFVHVFLCTCKHADPQILRIQTHTSLSGSMWLLGIWTQVCMFVQQALYQLKHSPVSVRFC